MQMTVEPVAMSSLLVHILYGYPNFKCLFIVSVNLVIKTFIAILPQQYDDQKCGCNHIVFLNLESWQNPDT